MNISEVCIRRPVLTTLMTASLIVFGAFAYRLLPVAALPAVDFPTIQITATLPGASPETMKFSGATWGDWRKRGHDQNSLVADPWFVAPEKNDFRLKPGSPALKLGFKPIDLSQVGVRKKSKRTAN